jgi:hypothetical protein
LYYAVTAQLEGYGEIWDSVTEVVTTYCSDGSHKTERLAEPTSEQQQTFDLIGAPIPLALRT